MNPTDVLWIVLAVAAVAAAGWFYWKKRQRRRRNRSTRRHIDRFRRKTGFDPEMYTAPEHTSPEEPWDPWKPDPRARRPVHEYPPFQQGARPEPQANAPYGNWAQPWHTEDQYTPEELARREKARRFRPVAPIYVTIYGDQHTVMDVVATFEAASLREQQVLDLNKQALCAYCETDETSEEKRAVDEQIMNVYFSQTGLNMVSEAVCELIDSELQRGVVAQRLRVRLYNTYLLAAQNTLDKLTMKLMGWEAVRVHPSYRELALTVRQTKATPDEQPRRNDIPAYMRRSTPSDQGAGYQQPADADGYRPKPRNRSQGWMEAKLELTPLTLQGDAQRILCIHEDNMEKIRRAVEKIENGESDDEYAIRYLPLLIALRKAYCSDFVLDFDKTIDTMSTDVCEQQLKNLRDALRIISEAYTQYPAM